MESQGRRMLFIVLSTCLVAAVTSYPLTLEDILKPSKSYVRPENFHGKTYMNVSVVLNSVEMKADRSAMQISGELVQEWEDENLRFSGGKSIFASAVGLYGEYGKKIKNLIWLPDITTTQAIEQHQISEKDFLRLHNDGRVVWTKQFSATVPCDMELAYYPFESYNCVMMFHSLGYNTDELTPQWSTDPAVYYDNTHVSLPCEIDEILNEVTTFVTVKQARYRLDAEIVMECYSGWTIKHTVLPFLVTISMSYMVFFLSPQAISARLTVSLLAYIISMFVCQFTYQDTPKYPYTMAIEIWTGTCLGFIFVSAIVSVVVEIMSRLPEKLAANSTGNGFSREGDEIHSRGHLAAQWIDKSFRILYPIGFIAFNIVYWIVLMTHVSQLHWKRYLN